LKRRFLSVLLLFLLLIIGSFTSVRAVSNTIPGDINGDGIVNMKDVALVAKALGSRPGDSNWNANADLDGNGIIDQKDLSIVLSNFGEAFPVILRITDPFGTNFAITGDYYGNLNLTVTTEYTSQCVLSYTIACPVCTYTGIPGNAWTWNGTYLSGYNGTTWINQTMTQNGNNYTSFTDLSQIYANIANLPGYTGNGGGQTIYVSFKVYLENNYGLSTQSTTYQITPWTAV
jgi:hypothetical protein